MADKVLYPRFFNVGTNGDIALYESDLGWSERWMRECGTDSAEAIFRHIVEEIGFNVLFFWVKTEEWYTIETEKAPIEVRMLYRNPDWDGDRIYQKSGLNGCPTTGSPGKILATFEEPTEIYDNLKIEGVLIGEVLLNSLITDLD